MRPTPFRTDFPWSRIYNLDDAPTKLDGSASSVYMHSFLNYKTVFLGSRVIEIMNQFKDFLFTLIIPNLYTIKLIQFSKT